MKNQHKRLILSFIVLSLFSVPTTSISAQEKLTQNSKVFINGIGSIRVGMTVNQASQATGVKLVSSGYQGDSSCIYVQPQREPKDIGFMVTNGRISRVDIFKNKRITTVKGAKIGDTEARIKSLYPGQIQVTKHKYTSGNYLTFVPKDKADKNYRIVFETDGTRVTQFRSGKLPEVEWVEGCS